MSQAEQTESSSAGEASGGEIVVLDGFSVVRSNRILFRFVLNDAVVGPWNTMDVWPPTLSGLKAWMDKEGGWDTSNLKEGATWDYHLVNYGLRQQFWIPSSSEWVEGGYWVWCVRDRGMEHVREGSRYKVVRSNGDMLTIVDDSGQERDYFADRFEEIPVLPKEKSTGPAKTA